MTQAETEDDNAYFRYHRRTGRRSPGTIVPKTAPAAPFVAHGMEAVY